MRVAVYPHSMEIGGSQLNAVQLAGAVRDRGHDVIVVSEPGPLVRKVHELGLEHLAIPERRRRPSAAVAAALVQLVDRRGIEVVHGYEWPPTVEAFFGPLLRRGVAVVSTVMSMSVVPFLPRTLPLMVGTAEIHDAAERAGHCHVTLLEPPVDTDADRPGGDTTRFRREHALDPDALIIGMVCRLVPQLKEESLFTACAAIEALDQRGVRVQLLIAGDGPLRERLARAADRARERTGRDLVVFAGELEDPTPAYAAADVLIGMGGSALRSMAFGKPLVVAGEQGFSELLTPVTAPRFLRTGWYGRGPGSRGSGPEALRRALGELADDAVLRAELGSFGRQLVIDRFSLVRAASLVEQQYTTASAARATVRRTTVDAARTATLLTAYKVGRKVARWRGTAAVDDANALAATRPTPTRKRQTV